MQSVVNELVQPEDREARQVHVHGQRYLVVSMDGVRNRNLVWKDTAIVPVASTADILVDMSNPGDWMLHSPQ